MHIPPFNNQNTAIVAEQDDQTPLVYFNIVKLKAGETFNYALSGYESCIVPATGSIDVTICPPILPDSEAWSDALTLRDAARREISAWCGEPDLVETESRKQEDRPGG